MSFHLATAGIILSALALGLFLVLFFSVDSIPLSTRVGALVASVVFLAFAGTMWIVLHRCRRRRGPRSGADVGVMVIREVELGGAAQSGAAAALTCLDQDGVGPIMFHYAELARATDNFDERRKLGEGGFGAVYRGVLRGCEVAIKRIVRERDGEKSFMAEVKTIGQLNQKNLVRLLGWCRDGSRFFVVYEYMPNRSLDRHLFLRSVAPPTVVVDGGGEGSHLQQQQQLTPPPLPWNKRYTIVLGLASAIKYLHEDLRECVVHRDIKPANVMLDANFEARLGDFGLARFVEHGNSVVTSQNAGTVQYMAPEVLHRGRGPSKESDVYSFGVVALEVACGKKASSLPEMEEEKLVAWVRRCHETGDLLRAADEELGGRFDEGQMRRLMAVGLMCTLQNRHLRPSITQVIHYLHPEATVPNVPADTPPPPSPPPALSIPPRTALPVTFGSPITNSINRLLRRRRFPYRRAQLFWSPSGRQSPTASTRLAAS